jgi:hypothetical protein
MNCRVIESNKGFRRKFLKSLPIAAFAFFAWSVGSGAFADPLTADNFAKSESKRLGFNEVDIGTCMGMMCEFARRESQQAYDQNCKFFEQDAAWDALGKMSPGFNSTIAGINYKVWIVQLASIANDPARIKILSEQVCSPAIKMLTQKK